jgi:hypothetical protein
MKRQDLPTAYCLLPTVVVLLGFILGAPLAPQLAWASQAPTPTPAPVEDADALAWAVLPWVCGLEALAVLLGLVLVFGRPAPAIIENANMPMADEGSEE